VTTVPGFRGAFRTDQAARAVYAEGAGIFRILPAAIAVPSDLDDLVTLVRNVSVQGTPVTAPTAAIRSRFTTNREPKNLWSWKFSWRRKISNSKDFWVPDW